MDNKTFLDVAEPPYDDSIVSDTREPSFDTLVSPVVVISPHYDDAVFSCGGLLANLSECTVVTVFTDIPHQTCSLTDWDRRCGFDSAGHAMRTRAAENRMALTTLDAAGIDLHFLDDQYPQRTTNGEHLLGDSLASTLSSMQAATVIFPLGLFHLDHIRVSDALVALCPQFPSITWIAYEDIPYRRQNVYVQRRIRQLCRQLYVSPFSVAAAHSGDALRLKERAVAAYRSQLRGLGLPDTAPILDQPETYWKIEAVATTI